MKKHILLLLVTITMLNNYAQQIPGKKQTEIINIVGATAHIGNGKLIKNSIITFENGIITTIADADLVKIKLKGRIIEATEKHVYPGFIALNTTLGLAEIDAVKASLDTREIGIFNPHIRSIIAYNTESKVTETVRVNGVLIGQITPRGGRISGQSSIVQFDAWNYEDAVIKADDGIHLNWPTSFNRSGWWAQPGSLKENKNYTKQTKSIQAFFEQNNTINTETKDLKKEALQGVFNGTKIVYVHVNGEKEIIDVIEFKNQFQIKKMVLIGGFEAYKQTYLLKENNVAVVIKRMHSLPTLEDQDIKLPYKTAKLLDDAGVLVAFDTAGSMERMNTRNLPFLAGTAVAYGLDYEKAIAMLTLNAAKIVGIETNFGSLEIGKSATLFISNGDALDMRTNNIEHVFIQGKKMSLDTHQKQLYRKFSNKYTLK